MCETYFSTYEFMKQDMLHERMAHTRTLVCLPPCGLEGSFREPRRLVVFIVYTWNPGSILSCELGYSAVRTARFSIRSLKP